MRPIRSRRSSRKQARASRSSSGHLNKDEIKRAAAARRPSSSAGFVGRSALAADAEREERNGSNTGAEERKSE